MKVNMRVLFYEMWNVRSLFNETLLFHFILPFTVSCKSVGLQLLGSSSELSEVDCAALISLVCAVKAACVQ